MLVDVHCHLDYPEFEADLGEVVARCGDVIIVNSIVQPDALGRGLGLAERYGNVYCTLGLTASDLDEDKFDRAVRLLREHQDKVVGLGEVGLDHYWVKDEEGKAVETRHFTGFVRLAEELGLPLVVHSRDAEKECINIIGEHKTRAIMHCFSGTIGQAREAVDLGCLISVPANVTYVKSRQRMVAALPLESIVLETDSPYLSPVRGARNEPANVRFAAEKVAELKNVDASVVEEVTTRNALGFLKIKDG
jgi:TatD DNase family protein